MQPPPPFPNESNNLYIYKLGSCNIHYVWVVKANEYVASVLVPPPPPPKIQLNIGYTTTWRDSCYLHTKGMLNSMNPEPYS